MKNDEVEELEFEELEFEELEFEDVEFEDLEFEELECEDVEESKDVEELEEVEEDRLSALPDILIFVILFHLPNTTLIESAITTFTLSKRWLALWTEFFIFKYQNPSNSFWPSALPDSEYVSQTLIQCRRSNLAKFQISGNYSDLLKSHIDNWIRYAVNCNVKDLNLTFTNNTEYVLEDFLFINSCLTHLYLYGCVFNPTCSISWNKLKRLSLSYTNLDEDMIKSILCGCPVLETFELRYCNGFELLNITSKSVKNLVITGYGDPEADEYPDIIFINAPYILSLTISGCLLVWNILLLKLSSLVEANLNFIKCDVNATMDEQFFGLIISLIHAKELNIGLSCIEVFSRLEARGFTFPSNVKKDMDSKDEAYLIVWPHCDVDSINSTDWECFHIRERSNSSLAGRITVKLLQDQTKDEDRISALPDNLLIEILSRLPETKYAIRTSTLAKRWLHLWTYVPNLIFRRDYVIRFSPTNFFTAVDKTLTRFLPADFFAAVEKTLTQCRQLKLYKFELHCYRRYDFEFESQVKNWIRHVVNCNVEELYLGLFDGNKDATFVLDNTFYNNLFITKMTLEGCIFKPTGAICWKKLKSLCINRGVLNEDLIENIQSGCPMLETLELIDCSGYMRLNITSKSVKNLIFSGFRDTVDEDNNPDLIEINAPNILSLTIWGLLWLGKLVLLNVASLINAHLDYWKHEGYNIEQQHMLKEFILVLRHVKELKIGISCFKTFFHLEATGFEFPSNLKILDSLEAIADWTENENENGSDDDSDLDLVTKGDWKELKMK